VDGNDTLRNIERLQFSDVTVNVAPTVALTAPADLATVSGTVPFSASVVPGIFNVVGVRFLVDGVTQIGAEDTTSPYSVQWNTTATANGSHSLTAVVRDTVGLTATSAARTVTVNNTVDTVAPTVIARSPLAGANMLILYSTVSTLASDGISVKPA
jgi:hypothetical protein